MKFSYSEFPELEKLETGKLGVIGIPPFDERILNDHIGLEIMKFNFREYYTFFNKEINYLTDPFKKAISKSVLSLVRDEASNNIEFHSGTLLNFEILGVENITAMYMVGTEYFNDLTYHNSVVYLNGMN